LNKNLFIGSNPVINSDVYKKLTTNYNDNCFSGFDYDGCNAIKSNDCSEIKSLFNQIEGYEYVNNYCCGINGINCDGGKIVSIDLSNKKLTGSIPSNIEKLTSLTYLNLNNNKLTGTLPSGVENLSLLTNIILSYNKLTGTIPKLPGDTEL